MTGASIPGWLEANQGYLRAALDLIQYSLETYIGSTQSSSSSASSVSARQRFDAARWEMPAPPALETICSRFALSAFERDVLLLCAGVQFDSKLETLCAAAQGNSRRSHPTFSLALAALPEAHWSALLPTAPLRHWRLIEIGPGDSVTASPLRIDECILHFLAGLPCLEERLRTMTESLVAPADVPCSHRWVAEQIANAWSDANSGSGFRLIQLCGDDLASKRAVVTATCALTGLQARVVASSLIPRGPAETDFFIRMWEREAALQPAGLLVEADELSGSDSLAESALERVLNKLRGPLFVSTPKRLRLIQRPALTFEVTTPTPIEQRELWHHALGPAVAALNGSVDALISQFSLGTAAIYAAAGEALQNYHVQPAASGAVEQPWDTRNQDFAPAVWQACRAYSRPNLEGLAQRIEPAAAWDDLVLPESQRAVLAEIALQVRNRAKVYSIWDFASKGSRGLGISALFSGPSGTGKTMASEVLANELRLDLYHIDLSQVISKYIGETEKNLRRVFDAAEAGSAILLFDEADALFGKRSDVKDSHDRYANVEISYLLQRMEAYRGLSVLATNLKSALDPAFLRRIRFLVHFPFPEMPHRAEIWKRIFPPSTPTEGLKMDRLARLNITGGNIRNIAMNAAFLAADANEPVRMTHVLRAARSEYSKLEKTLTEAETAGWL
jgi:hypothetical protein